MDFWLVQWNFAWDLKFGLYEWNDDGTQRRTLRNGAKACPAPFCPLESVCKKAGLHENVMACIVTSSHFQRCALLPALRLRCHRTL